MTLAALPLGLKIGGGGAGDVLSLYGLLDGGVTYRPLSVFDAVIWPGEV